MSKKEETTSTALIPVTSKEEIEKIFLSPKLQETIGAIVADANNFVSQTETEKGRKAYRSKAYEISKQIVVIERW